MARRVDWDSLCQEVYRTLLRVAHLGPVRRVEVAQVIGCSPRQVGIAVAMLRQNYALIIPLTSSPKGYLTTFDHETLLHFRVWRAGNANTSLIRWWRGVGRAEVQERVGSDPILMAEINVRVELLLTETQSLLNGFLEAHDNVVG